MFSKFPRQVKKFKQMIRTNSNLTVDEWKANKKDTEKAESEFDTLKDAITPRCHEQAFHEIRTEVLTLARVVCPRLLMAQQEVIGDSDGPTLYVSRLWTEYIMEKATEILKKAELEGLIKIEKCNESRLSEMG